MSAKSGNFWTRLQQLLVNALVTSKLDYCNSLLFGLPDYLIHQLQRCHDNAARVISLTRKYDHITPVLHDLHWLPVDYRIKYKIILISYKSLNSQGPAYLKDLLQYRKSKRCLRSTDDVRLQEPRFRLDSYGARSFISAASRLWNSLPTHLRQEQPGADKSSKLVKFKKDLKTYLFHKAYYS